MKKLKVYNCKGDKSIPLSYFSVTKVMPIRVKGQLNENGEDSLVMNSENCGSVE